MWNSDVIVKKKNNSHGSAPVWALEIFPANTTKEHLNRTKLPINCRDSDTIDFRPNARLICRFSSIAPYKLIRSIIIWL